MSGLQKTILKISKLEGILACVLFIAFIIYFIPSPGHAFRIHDTGDGLFTSRHVLIETGHFFDTDPETVVPGIMNGLPRGVFPGFLDPTVLLMYLFGSLTGYSINFLLIRLLALAGFYLFGRDHLRMGEDKRGLLLLMSVVFASLPFFLIHGLTAAGLPLLLWAFFNLYKQERTWMSYMVFVLFGLWSSFVLVGVHIFLFLGGIALALSVHKKKIQFPLFYALVLLGVVYVLANYMLFYMHYFNSNYKTFREGFEKALNLNFKGVLGTTVKLFLTGEYSSAGYLGYLFLPLFAYFLLLGARDRRHPAFRMGLFFCIAAFVFAFFIALLDWQSFSFFYNSFPLARKFNFQRFTNLLPGVFFLGLLSAFAFSNQSNKLVTRLLSSALIIISFVFIWRGNISFNRNEFVNNGTAPLSAGYEYTFNEFFDTSLFREIKAYMGQDTTANVIHFCTLPSPSKYAGLPVLDDYQSDYPMEYKREFRKIIAGELDKSPTLKENFDGWGAKCYLRSATFTEGRGEMRNGLNYEAHLDIDTDQLRKMSCKYILSEAIIGNADTLGLAMKKVFSGPVNHKNIFLYYINPNR